jgi:uncharacterized protein (TIGR01319 family)
VSNSRIDKEIDTGPAERIAVCADVGSTFTKVAAVDLDTGALLATASRPTTVTTDVLIGLDAAIADIAAQLPGADLTRIHACSSAGGGLRLAVVGYEPLVTAEAGHRVGLSAGAKVVHIATGKLTTDTLAALKAAHPDVILLVGGTDGGEEGVLRHNAHRLATARIRIPVVVAGNADARDDVCAEFTARGVPHVATDNVLPRIGVLNPTPARAAIRDVFLRHVIGGKKLSRGPRFASLVRGATPDLVLTAVELLGDDAGCDLLVVDIGGATTDVYSVLTPDPELRGGPRAEVAGTMWRSRTVEGDLGMRWSATGVIDAARAEKLPVPDGLAEAAARRTADTDLLPATDTERAEDRDIAALAAMVALRRHARGEPGGAPRKDLRAVRVAIGSGGVLRHADPGTAASVLAAPLNDLAGGWPLPRHADAVVDGRYILAAAGLLASDFPDIAAKLLHRELLTVGVT